MIEKLEDGRKVLVLDDNVKACALVTIGDTDKDGAIGLRVQVLADIPFDGQDAKPLFDSGEIEAFPKESLPDGVASVVEGLTKKAKSLMDLVGGLLK